MKAFLIHFSFEYRTGIRNRSLLFLTYLFPLAFFAIVGALMVSVNPTFRETMIPAMVTFAILSGSLLSQPDPIVNARQAGIFRSYKINGLPAESVLFIPALSSMTHIFLTSLIMLVASPLFFDAPLPVNWLYFILVGVLITLACVGLGLLIGVISTSSQMTVLWAQLVFLPSMILGGLMMPHSVLPEGLRRIAILLPTTHAMNAFRGLAYASPTDYNPWWSVLILATGSLIAFFLALHLFTWDSQDKSKQRRMLLALLAVLPYGLGMLML